jgi:hypothetical protein
VYQRAPNLLKDSALILRNLKDGVVLNIPPPIGWVDVAKRNPSILYLRPAISDMLKEVIALYEQPHEQEVVIMYFLYCIRVVYAYFIIA